MNPRFFLRIAGVFLVSVGILGITGLFGKISAASFFHPPYWINFVHLGIGILTLIASYKFSKKYQSALVAIPAALGTLLGVFGLIFGSWVADKYNIPELKDPSDHIAHLTVGISAIWALSKRE